MTEEKKTVASNKDVEDSKVIAVIGYLGILCLVPLLAKKDSPFAQYHGKQGLVLLIFEVIIMMIAWIPIIGWFLSPIGWIIVLIFTIIGMVNALNGSKKELPVIGKYAKSLNI